MKHSDDLVIMVAIWCSNLCYHVLLIYNLDCIYVSDSAISCFYGPQGPIGANCVDAK